MHSVIFRKFPQKCAPSVDKFKPIREGLQKDKKVKANAQGYSHLPTHLMVLTDRSNTNMFKKISLGTQFFIFFKLWLIGKQYYEIVNKFWLVNYEIETAPTYEKSHSVAGVVEVITTEVSKWSHENPNESNQDLTSRGW